MEAYRVTGAGGTSSPATEFLARIIDSIEEAVISADLDGRITSWNRGAERIYGYSAGEALGQHVSILPPQARSGEPMDAIRRIFEGEPSIRVETVRARKDGALIDCWISLSPVKDEDGRVVGVCAVLGDRTEHKRLSARVSEQESLFKGLLEQIVAGVFILGTDRRIRYINEGFTRLFDYEPEQVIGRPIEDFLPDSDVDRVRERMAAAFEGPTGVVETRVLDRSGRPRTVIAQSTSIQHDGIPALLGVVIDVTEHRQTEAALQRANQLLRTVVAANQVLVGATSEAGLMRSMCDVLVSTGHVEAAAIVLPGDDGDSEVFASAGVDPARLDVSSLAGGIASRQDPSSGETRSPRGLHVDALGNVWLPLADGDLVFGHLWLRIPSMAAADDEYQLLKELADDLAYGIVALRHREAREAFEERLTRSMEEAVSALAATVELRDPYTAGHQRRVAQLAGAIAGRMGLDSSRISALRLAATVHDIGKIKIPSELLTKPGALSAVEEQMLQTHAEAGYDILKGIDFPWPVALFVRQHHERLDGSGYPLGLTGSDMALESRILAVADVVEAISADRPYRFGKGLETALSHIEAGRGREYDAGVVDVCLDLFRRDGFQFTAAPLRER